MNESGSALSKIFALNDTEVITVKMKPKDGGVWLSYFILKIQKQKNR